ncbi:MAG: Rieske (2Fe-2S) protein [Chloroflexota bacterium]|jgi:3-phenylpropionate/trans-cinnamate dioxygenase ferredoxin subunit|nr:Rieske (2Fe-2S) protein [Chloroflexota bacterium]
MTERHQSSNAKRWPVARTADIAPGECRIVEIKRHSVGIFNVNGEFVAVLNVCPHELAPVCRGNVTGTTLPSSPGEYRWGRDGEILSCPWHGWEFDLLTGKSLADPKVGVRRYPTEVHENTIFVVL